MKHGHRSGNGFTLVELLTVVAIIALLIAIALPSLSAARAAGRTKQCAANLHSMSVAWSTLRSQGSPVSQHLWGVQLIAFMDEHDASFLCPEDLVPYMSGLDAISIRTYDGGGRFLHDMDVFGNLDQYGNSGQAGDSDFTWRCNQEEYSRLTDPTNFLLSGDARDQLKQYTPGDTPNVSYLIFEDLRGANSNPDYDFSDFAVRMEIDGDYVNVSAAKGRAGYCFDVIGPDGTVMNANRLTQWNNDANIFGSGAFNFRVRGLLNSYGANNMIGSTFTGSDSVVILDYEKGVANVAGDDGNPIEFNVYKAPRHGGKSNVLFGDGSVRLLTPGEIDPNHSETQDKWVPPQKRGIGG